MGELNCSFTIHLPKNRIKTKVLLSRCIGRNEIGFSWCQWVLFFFNSLEYSILRCSQVPLTQNTNTLPLDETEFAKLLSKIINYEKKVKKPIDIVVYSKINPVSNPPKSVWSEIGKYFKKLKEKDKKSGFKKQLHNEVFLVCMFKLSSFAFYYLNSFNYIVFLLRNTCKILELIFISY